MSREAAGLAEAHPVVENIGQAHVGEVVPCCEQEGPGQRQWRPTQLIFGPEAEMPASKRSSSVQSTTAATSSSAVPPRGLRSPTANCSCPIRRRATASSNTLRRA